MSLPYGQMDGSVNRSALGWGHVLHLAGTRVVAAEFTDQPLDTGKGKEGRPINL